MLQRALSSIIVLALVGAMPGLEPYRAAAAVVNGNVGRAAPVTGSVGRVQISPVQMPGLTLSPAALAAPTLSPTLSAPAVKAGVSVNAAAAQAAGIQATITPEAEAALMAAPSAVAPSAKKVTVINAFQPAAQPAQSIPETALGRLAIPLPEFGKMGTSDSKAAAESDFLTRIGFKSSSKKSQPDQRVGEDGPDDRGEPSRGDTDELGNERRRQDPGPDDTWDGTDQRGGNDGLFSSLSFSKSSKGSSKKSTPDQRVGEQGPDDRGDSGRGGDIDELGNERRQTDDGPDSVSDEFGGGVGNNNSGLFAAAVGLGVTGALAAASLTTAVFTLALLLPALILHEMGHAKVASVLGDQTAKLQGRMSFKPKDLLTHIDPFFTLLLPFVMLMTSGIMFGGARPVPVDASNFKNPVKDMAKVAFAGPATNFILAVAGGVAFLGLAAAGITGIIPAVVASFTFMNVFLGLFNLLPLAPLDGSHILRAVLPQRAAAALDGFYAKLGGFQMVVMILGALLVAPFLGQLALLITGVLLSGGAAVGAFSMASAFLPAVAALGILMGQMKSDAPKTLQAAGGAAAVNLLPRSENPELIVILDGAPRNLTADMHLSNVDLNLPNAVEVYAQTLQALQRQLAAAGIETETLERFNVTPIASYKRINAATLQVDAARSMEFRKLLESRGYKVYDNARREIVRPVPIPPESLDPSAAGAITMAENKKIVKATKAEAEAKSRWGEPTMGFFARLVRRVLLSVIPQPAVAVIDTGVDLEHPLLKRMKGAKDVGNTNGKDDNGHGTWVASTILNQAPWLRNLTSYKTFTDGGATLDDILKALTMAANDGNIVMSNSWGSDDGDPTSPDSLLVKKLAEEGHVMVFAAGNAGPRANTVGSPAITTHIDPATGAPYVVAVAATDRNKKVAYFSSRGPGSSKTKNDPSYPHRPDIAAPGYNTEGAWPTWMRGDRVDPKDGNIKAISGTSMSTPDIAGIIAHLAMLFGVTTKGRELSLIVKALMDTAEKTSEGPDAVGHYGFVNVDAAYEALKQIMKPAVPNFVARWVLKLVK